MMLLPAWAAAKLHKEHKPPTEVTSIGGKRNDGHNDEISGKENQDRPHRSYLGPRSDKLLRVAALNVGQFPIDPIGPKMADFFGLVKKIKADKTGFSEFGLNPLAMARHQQWSECTRGQCKTLKTSVAFN
jgi:hypothetical protein